MKIKIYIFFYVFRLDLFSQLATQNNFYPLHFDSGKNWENVSLFNDIVYSNKEKEEIDHFRSTSSFSLFNNSFGFDNSQFIKFKSNYFGYLKLSNRNRLIDINSDPFLTNLKYNNKKFNLFSSGFGYKNDWVFIKLSKGSEKWGAGENIDLALSNQSQPYEYVKVASNYGSIKVAYIYGFLEKTSENINRYITSRGIEWTNKKSLIMGFSETVIYSGLNRSFEIGYINPVASHIEIELNDRLQKTGTTGANAVWQFHIDSFLGKYNRVSLNYLIDELVLDKNLEIGKEDGTAISFRVSHNLINKTDQFLSIYYRHISVGTPTFRHGVGTNNFVNKGIPLGWNRGSDSQEISIGVNSSNNKSVYLFLICGYYKSGDENIRERVFDTYADYLKSKFPSGKQKKELFLNALFQYWINNNTAIYFKADVIRNSDRSLFLGVSFFIPTIYRF